MNPSPLLMRKMGLRFARGILSFDKLESEEKLWRSVVINAIEDCMIDHSDRKPSLIKIEAHNWIVSRTKDFDLVCTWGKLDPDDIEECYIKALRNLHMRFTLRQLKWFDYDKIYKKMLASSPPKKKKLRKDLNDLREVVKNTPTTYISTIFVSAFV